MDTKKLQVSCWRLTEDVTEAYPVRDDVAHSVKLKTSNGELFWPSVMLCLLEAAD